MKSSLVMILALVGMVGCRSVKHVEPPDFQRIADEWNHAHPRDGVSYGNAAVILPKNPAKKPKAKKRYAMDDGDNYREFEVDEQPKAMYCQPGKYQCADHLRNGKDIATCLIVPNSETIPHLPACTAIDLKRLKRAVKKVKPTRAAVPVAMTGDPMYPGSGWNFEMKGSHVVWLKDGGYLCEANDGSQNNSCREVEQGEIDWHAAHPEDYTRSFYKSIEKAK